MEKRLLFRPRPVIAPLTYTTYQPTNAMSRSRPRSLSAHCPGLTAAASDTAPPIIYTTLGVLPPDSPPYRSSDAWMAAPVDPSSPPVGLAALASPPTPTLCLPVSAHSRPNSFFDLPARLHPTALDGRRDPPAVRGQAASTFRCCLSSCAVMSRRSCSSRTHRSCYASTRLGLHLQARESSRGSVGLVARRSHADG